MSREILMQSPVVTTAWLEEHLHDDNLRIVELRGGVLPPTEPPPHYLTDREGYLASHIPNAIFVDWQVDIVEPGSPSSDIAPPERFAALMSRLGIGNNHHVVVYDNAASVFACRMRWALRYYGHEAVSVIDGGWKQWLLEGRQVTSVVPDFEPTTFVARETSSLKATADDILAGLAAGGMQLIDVRSPSEFRGESSRAKVGGHIPSAINLPWNLLATEGLTLKPADELRLQFERAGIDRDAPDTVLYCNSGVSATYGMLALEVLGARNLRLYDGSWKEWGNDPATPKATST